MTGEIVVGAMGQGHDLLDWATPIFTLLGVFVVGLYTYYAKKQRDEAKRANDLTEQAIAKAAADSEATVAQAAKSNEATIESNRIADKALELGRRAWLIPKIGKLRQFDGELWVTIDISNSGGIPGIIVKASGKATVATAFPDLVTDEPVSDDPQSYQLRGVIVEPGPSATSFYIRLPTLTNEIKASLDRTKTIVVYCYVEYTDVFRKAWVTALCWWGFDRSWSVAPQYTQLI
jgi:hypothetical protein